LPRLSAFIITTQGPTHQLWERKVEEEEEEEEGRERKHMYVC